MQQSSLGNEAIRKALVDEQNKAKLPKNHTQSVMQRINGAKMVKDLLELEIVSPIEVFKSLNNEKEK